MDNTKLKITFIVLIMFALMRPIISLSFFSTTSIASITLREIIGLGVSYVLLLCLFLIIKEIKIDLIGCLLLVLSAYSLLSIAWGSDARDVAKFIFPFFLFFAVRTAAKNEFSIVTLVSLMFIGFMIPVFGSFAINLTDRGVYRLLYWSGLIRYTIQIEKPPFHVHVHVA